MESIRKSKYSNRFSVFFLPEVNPDDIRFFSSDPRLIPGVDACINGTTARATRAATTSPAGGRPSRTPRGRRGGPGERVPAEGGREGGPAGGQTPLGKYDFLFLGHAIAFLAKNNAGRPPQCDPKKSFPHVKIDF